jgi:hypothetical protein
MVEINSVGSLCDSSSTSSVVADTSQFNGDEIKKIPDIKPRVIPMKDRILFCIIFLFVIEIAIYVDWIF